MSLPPVSLANTRMSPNTLRGATLNMAIWLEGASLLRIMSDGVSRPLPKSLKMPLMLKLSPSIRSCFPQGSFPPAILRAKLSETKTPLAVKSSGEPLANPIPKMSKNSLSADITEASVLIPSNSPT